MRFSTQTYNPELKERHKQETGSQKYAYISPYNYAENRPIDGIDLWGLQYLRYDDVESANFQASTITVSGINRDGSFITTNPGNSSTMTENSDGTYNFSYLGNEYSNIEAVEYNGENFLNMGEHIADVGGTRHTEWIYTDIQLFDATTDHTYTWADSTLTGTDHLGNPSNTNCAYLAEAQANELGTNLQGGVVSQRNALNYSGGTIVQLNTDDGIDYINSQLEAGNAVVVGVDYTSGGTDVGTDHYVTITGRTSDAGQGRFLFMENAVGTAANVRNFTTNRFIPGTTNITGGSVYESGMTVTRIQRNQE